MFTSKSTADFAMQNPFKVWSAQEEMSRYQFFALFTLKELCMAKSTQALDANRPLSKYAARQTQFFEEIQHVQREILVKRCKLADVINSLSL